MNEIDRSFRLARSAGSARRRMTGGPGFLPRFPDRRPDSPEAARVLAELLARNRADQPCDACGERTGAHPYMDAGECPTL